MQCLGSVAFITRQIFKKVTYAALQRTCAQWWTHTENTAHAVLVATLLELCLSKSGTVRGLIYFLDGEVRIKRAVFLCKCHRERFLWTGICWLFGF